MVQNKKESCDSDLHAIVKNLYRGIKGKVIPLLARCGPEGG